MNESGRDGRTGQTFSSHSTIRPETSQRHDRRRLSGRLALEQRRACRYDVTRHDREPRQSQHDNPDGDQDPEAIE